MERSEPTFVPEWYKGKSSSAIGSSNSNHNNGSLHSATDEHNYGVTSRNRLSLSVCDHDAPRLLSQTDRTSLSIRRTGSSDGSSGREKELASRAYSSFGRSYRDRDRDREKDLDIRNRDRTLLLDNGFSNYPDSLNSNKPEKNFLRRSQSSLSGRRFDSWKRPEHESSNGVLSEGSIATGISKSSFERDFPSLGAEEKYMGSEDARVSSPGLTSAIHILPVTASAIIGSDGWTSALAEVPPIVGGNGPVAPSSLQTNPAVTTVSNTYAGLNMAEALAQAPARVCTAPQPPSDSQKIEELHRQQILKLRPVTPSMPKNLGLNSADKSKTKGARAAEFSASKGAQQTSSQLVSHTLRSVARSDVLKTSQPGHFQVLNRERNGLSPTGKENPNPTNVFRVPTTSNALPSPQVQPSKGPTNLRLKFDGKSGASAVTSYGEKKTPSQAQNRNDFFNSLRKKTSVSQHTNANDDPSCDTSSSNMEKVGEQVVADSASAMRDMPSLKNTLQCSMENGNCSVGVLDDFEPEKLAVDEEEAAFLRSLGWEENAGEEALTREEIESFLSEHKNQRLTSKLKL